MVKKSNILTKLQKGKRNSIIEALEGQTDTQEHSVDNMTPQGNLTIATRGTVMGLKLLSLQDCQET